MRKTASLFFVVFIVFFGLLRVASAGTISIAATFTGDNLINGWFLDSGIAQSLGITANSGSAGDWRIAKSGSASVNSGDAFSLIWQVVNDDNDSGYRQPGLWNPGGFLGQITGTTFGTILSSQDGWSYAIRDNIKSTASLSGYLPFTVTNFTGWEWSPVATYGTNAEAWPWRYYGGPVDGISPDAEWIWAANNFDAVGAPGADKSVFIRYQFPVPEPTSIMLLFTGLICVGIASRQKK